MVKPLEAYRGSDPYLFVSYSHQDAEEVFPEIERLDRRGFRIWYDEGIDPATIWTNEIYKALENASLVLAFLSPRAALSEYVRKEIHMAIVTLKKPVVVIDLAETALTGGLALLLADIQAVRKFEMHELDYQRTLERALPAACRLHENGAIIEPPEERIYQDGLALQEAGQHDRAIECFSRAIELNPRDPEYSINRAASLIQMQKYADAIRDCDTVICLTPNRAKHFYLRGMCHLGLGRYHACRADFEKAHSLDPSVQVPAIVKTVKFKLLSFLEKLGLRNLLNFTRVFALRIFRAPPTKKPVRA
jgi:tetratricopeptide (TPR) repeat protein